jgi:putative endonuclease
MGRRRTASGDATGRGRSIGAVGERVAEHYLTSRGCTIVDRNAHVEADEIDLVVRDGHSLVAVEVKCSTAGDPLEAVDDAKYGRLERAVAAYGRHIDRIDLLTVRIRPEFVEVRWLRGVG